MNYIFSVLIVIICCIIIRFSSNQKMLSFSCGIIGIVISFTIFTVSNDSTSFGIKDEDSIAIVSRKQKKFKHDFELMVDAYLDDAERIDAYWDDIRYYDEDELDTFWYKLSEHVSDLKKKNEYEHKSVPYTILEGDYSDLARESDVMDRSTLGKYKDAEEFSNKLASETYSTWGTSQREYNDRLLENKETAQKLKQKLEEIPEVN